jgi:sugar phosphate isomerase/epimerase
VGLVRQAALAGIEWGADVHVPHGDVEQAKLVRQLTEDAGLQVAAYGSYYRITHHETGPFDAVLETAAALAAPAIRVWAGKKGIEEADSDYWQAVVDESKVIAKKAAKENIRIVYEFHANTLTDTNNGARGLLEDVKHKNVLSYWQPPRYSQIDYNLTGLDMVMPFLYGLHVFHWDRDSGERRPLSEGREDWRLYLEKANAKGKDMFALIEFVEENKPENFLRDAATLKEWLAAI